MDILSWVGLLLAVFLGSYIQAVAGFAMGMIIVAVVGGLRLVDLPTLGAVVSLLSLSNIILSLRGQTRHIDRRMSLWLAIGQVPAIYLGLQLMTWLNDETLWVLELSLGLFVLIGGLSMWLRPHPWAKVSSPFFCWLTGSLGGVLGGMFSASGPVMGWFGYSQPLPLAVIRATLLTSFAVTTSTRTVMVGIEGGLTMTVLTYVGLALPLVLLGTWLGRNFTPWVDEQLIKRGANAILLIMGVWILATVAFLH